MVRLKLSPFGSALLYESAPFPGESQLRQILCHVWTCWLLEEEAFSPHVAVLGAEKSSLCVSSIFSSLIHQSSLMPSPE